MRKWATLVAALYALILLVLAGPVIALAFVDEIKLEYIAGVYAYWPVYAWAAALGLAQFALLVIPVRVAQRRPIARRAIIWPMMAAFFLLLLMAAAMIVTVAETLENSRGGLPDGVRIFFYCLVGAVWLLWALLFGFYTGGREPTNVVSRLVRFLIAGSVLELLVAVPVHVLARCRNYCCAGFGTFWGLATGISVMLFAFGPAALALFIRRWGAVRNKTDGDA